MSNHYYRSDTGLPQYTVIGTNGKERNTTVADCRKLGLVPSYSTIVGLLDKPGLAVWLENQLLEAALDWPYDGNWSNAPEYEGYEHEDFVKQWKKDVKDIAGRIGRQGRDRGTFVHDLLEKAYKGQDVGRENDALISPVLNMIDNKIEGLRSYLWIAEESFSFNGYGGKVDLHSKHGGGEYYALVNADGLEIDWADTEEEANDKADNFETVVKKERGYVIDFKTKDVDDIKKMKPYPNDVMQHAAYRDGLGIPHAKCYSLFVNVRQSGMLSLHEWEEEQVKKGKEMFNLLKMFWYLSNNVVMK